LSDSINPGGVETEGVHRAGIIGSDFEKQLIAGTPLGRLGQPEDIAPIAVFLASEDAGWLMGETLVASRRLPVRQRETGRPLSSQQQRAALLGRVPAGCG